VLQYGYRMDRERELTEKILQLESQVQILKGLVIELSGGGNTGRDSDEFAKAEKQAQIFTMKQHAVLQLVHDGASNREIGEALEVTESTVKVHVKAIMDKLGVRTRSQVALATKELMGLEADDYEKLTRVPRGWSRNPDLGDEATRLIKTKTK